MSITGGPPPPGLTPRDYRTVIHPNLLTRDVLIEVYDHMKEGFTTEQLIAIFNVTKPDMRMRMFRLRKWECIKRTKSERVVDHDLILKELSRKRPSGKIYKHVVWFTITHWGMKCAARWKQEREDMYKKEQRKLAKKMFKKVKR